MNLHKLIWIITTRLKIIFWNFERATEIEDAYKIALQDKDYRLKKLLKGQKNIVIANEFPYNLPNTKHYIGWYENKIKIIKLIKAIFQDETYIIAGESKNQSVPEYKHLHIFVYDPTTTNNSHL